MGDLKSPRLMYAKALLLAIAGMMAVAGIMIEAPSWRIAASSLFVAPQRAYMAPPMRKSSSPGSSRPIRRDQKRPRLTVPLVAISSSNSDVIRKPDSTKNRSTPRYPPRRRSKW